MRTPRFKSLTLAAAALAWLACATPPRVAARGQDAQKSADDKFGRGRRLYEQGDAEGAIPLLRAAAESRKTDADAWYFYGLALSRAAHRKEARKAFERTLALRPDDALAHVGLAYSLLFLNKERDAEGEARRALSLNPQLAEARYVVGVIRFTEGKFSESAEEAEAALRLKPELPAAAYLLGDALLNLYAEEFERLAEKYPLAPAAVEAERKAVLAKREPELEPVRARMLAAAERLDSFVSSRPKDPEAPMWREQAESLRVYGRTGVGSAFRSTEVTQRAVIISKPAPGYTQRARENGTRGVVRLRVVLAADGHVRHILVVRRLPDGLTEMAIAAAQRIKFTPATIGGRPVSQFVTLEYNFYID